MENLDIDISDLKKREAAAPAAPADEIDISDLPKRDTTVRDNYREVVDKKVDPAQAAKVINISRSSGLPPELVASDIDLAQKAFEAPDFDVVKSQAPYTYDFLKDKGNMAIARDDIHKLVDIEKTVKAHNVIQAFNAGFSSTGFGMMLNRELPSVEIPENAPFTHKLASMAGGLAGDFPAMVAGGIAAAPAAAASGPGAPFVESAAAFAAPAAFRQAMIEHYKNPDLDLPQFFKSAYSVGLEAAKGAAIGAATAGGAKLGGRLVTGPAIKGEGFVMTKAVPAWKLSAAKTGGELAGMTAGGAAIDQKMPTAEDVAANTLLIGGLHAAGAVTGAVKDMRRAQLQTESTKAYLARMHELVAETKMRDIDAGAMNRILSEQANPVYIPVEAFNTLFQKEGIDPAEAAKKFGLSESHAEAMRTNGDVQIPMGTYMGKEMEKYHAVLEKDVKVDPEHPTENQRINSQKEISETAKDINERAGKLIEATPDAKAAYDIIREDIATKASSFSDVKDPRAKAAAEQAADVLAKYFVVQGDELKRDPLQVYEDKKLRMYGPGQQAPATLLQERSKVPTFYSNLQNLVNKKMGGSATVEQVRAIMKDAKSEEIEWSHVEDFLQGKEKVGKEELMSFLRESGVQVQEVMRGQKEFNIYDPESGDLVEGGFEKIEDARAALQKHTSEWGDDIYIQQEIKGDKDTKFSQYTLPGGENYRELLLTMPELEKVDTSKWTYQQSRDGITVTDDKGNIYPTTASTFADAREQAVRVYKKTEGFKSSHFDEPNILAHIRFNDRMVDGKKMLFIEEVQSDWHQAGRKKGYESSPKTREDLEEELKKLDEIQDSGESLTPEQAQRMDEIDYLLSENKTGGVPNAPFKKTWHELALKRMLRYAVENGYDSIGWTTGEQQAERYDLSKQIKTLRANRMDTPNGERYSVDMVTATGDDHHAGTFEASQLSDVVGKDLAEKIVSNKETFQKYSGLALKVGGEGMAGFYDKMLPSYLSKLTKKWGGKVEDATISAGENIATHWKYDGDRNWWTEDERLNIQKSVQDKKYRLWDYGNNNDPKEVGAFKTYDEAKAAADKHLGVVKNRTESVHSLTITDPMRESVMYEGMPLFQRYGAEHFQPAWHGSPYNFDKFTLDHIGKGEGAQAYGWGLYFAGDKKVAEYYRKSVKDPKHIDNRVVNEIAEEHLKAAQGNKEKAIQTLEELFSQSWSDKKRVKKAITVVKTGKLLKVPEGKLYEVSIPEDEVMLEWDRPLAELDPQKREQILSVINDTLSSEKAKTATWFHAQKSIDHLKAAAGKETWYKDAGVVQFDNPLGISIYQDVANILGSDKEASLMFNKHGVKGIKYLDQQSRGSSFKVTLSTEKGEYSSSSFPTRGAAQDYLKEKQAEGFKGDISQEGTFNYVIFDDKAIDILNKYYQGQESEPLASYTKTQQGHIIKMFKNANASSFIHEMGHFILEDVKSVAESGKASPEYVADWNKIQDYIGHKTGEGLSVDQHEKFAKTFEAYIMKGEAPTPELKTAFHKMRDWMLQVYDGVKRKLGMEVTPEIRGVFDRLLAGKEAVDMAREELGPDLGLPELKGEALRARQMAEDMMLKPIMEQLREENKAKIEGERSAAMADAIIEVDKQPVYAAIKDLTDTAYEKGEKLTEQMVRNDADRYVQNQLSDERVELYDAIAELHGFSSGDELLKKIYSSDRRDAAINKMVGERMAKSTKMDSESLKEEAMKVLHDGDNLGKLMALEAQVLEGMRMNKDIQAEVSKARRELAAQEWANAKAEAASTLGDKRWKEAVKFRNYITLERKAAEQAAKATVKKDFESALKAKREQLVSHAFAAESLRLKDITKKQIKYLEKQQSADQKTFHHIQYFSQVAAILDRFGFARKDYAPELKDESLGEWDAKNNNIVEDWLKNESIRKNYKELSVKELKDISNAISYIKAVANRESGIKQGNTRANIDAVGFELAKSAQESGMIGKTPRIGRHETLGEVLSKMPSFINEQLITIESLLKDLDGGKVFGPWYKAWFREYTKAADNFSEDNVVYADKYKKIWDSYSEKEKKELTKPVFIPELKDSVDGTPRSLSLSKNEIMMATLYMGTETSKQRLLEGYGWTEQDFNSARNRILTKKDYDTIQAVWDMNESLWPRVSAKYTELYGFAPDKIKHIPLETPYGIYEGGYVHLRPDERFSIRMKETLDAQEKLGQHPTGFWASVENGYSKSRVKGAKYCVSLNIRNIERNITDVLQDINMREWVMDANRLLKNENVSKALLDAYGENGVRIFKNWVDRIAGDHGYESLDSVMAGIRRNMVVASLGLRITSGILQADDVGAYGNVDPKNFNTVQAIAAISSTYKDVAFGRTKMSDIIKFVQDNSKYMKYERGEAIDRDTRDVGKRMEGKNKDLANAAMVFAVTMDRFQSYPIWIAAFKVGLKLGEGDKGYASEYADMIIRRAQADGRVGNMAKIMTGNEFMKTLTIFGSFQNKRLNLWRERIRDTKELSDIPGLVGTFMTLGVMPVVLAGMVHNGVPNSKEKRKKWLKDIVTAPTSYFPVVRDISDYLVSDMVGMPSFGYVPSPAGRMVTQLDSTIKTLMSKKSKPLEKVEAISRSVAYAVPYPQQINDWAFNIANIVHGDMKPHVSDVIKRRPKKERHR